MAEEKPPSRDEKIRAMIRWNSADAEAIAQQLLERVQRGIKEGLTMGVVVCFVHADDEGKRSYEPAFSTLPVEVSMWALNAIKRRIEEVNGRG